MSFVLIDTNVPISANKNSKQADPACVIACIDALTQVREQDIVLLDDKMRILQEYMHNLSLSGRPGAGDFFLKWLWNVQADQQHCHQVTITPLDEDPKDFREFPRDALLANFDPPDRKFVAVALASKKSPNILNAVDTDWANHFAALRNAGVHLKFLCPHYTSPKE